MAQNERVEAGAGQADHRTRPGRIARLQRRAISIALRVRLVRSYLLYVEHRGPMLADSITYRALFSVFAGVLLLFSMASLWLSGNPAAVEALRTSLDHVIPGLSGVVDVSKVAAPAGFTIAGIVSLVALIGAGIGAITSLRTALRVLADQFVDTSFFLWVIVRNLLVGIGFGGLLLVSAVASFLGSAGIGAVMGWLGLPAQSWVAQSATQALGILIVFAIDTLAIAMVFLLLAGIRAPARALWTGAALGGIGLTVLQELSGLFVRGASANPLLASFAGLIALLLWFNLSAQVILIASSHIVIATEEGKDRIRTRYGAQTLAQRQLRGAEDRVRSANAELAAAQGAERKEREG